jgi:hypothetical protein
MYEVCRFLLTVFKKSGGVLMHKLLRLLISELQNPYRFPVCRK